MGEAQTAHKLYFPVAYRNRSGGSCTFSGFNPKTDQQAAEEDGQGSAGRTGGKDQGAIRPFQQRREQVEDEHGGKGHVEGVDTQTSASWQKLHPIYLRSRTGGRIGGDISARQH